MLSLFHVSCCTCDTLMVINYINDIHLILAWHTENPTHMQVNEKMHSGAEEIYDDMGNVHWEMEIKLINGEIFCSWWCNNIQNYSHPAHMCGSAEKFSIQRKCKITVKFIMK